MGSVELESGKVELGGNDGKSICLFESMPENCRIDFDFTVGDDIGDFGLLLRTGARADEYYAVKFEPKFNRLSFDRVPRRDSTLHCQVDVERYCPISVGEKHSMTVIAEGSVCEVYVDGKTAMSARMFDFKQGGMGFYAQNTAVRFENISVFTAE